MKQSIYPGPLFPWLREFVDVADFLFGAARAGWRAVPRVQAFHRQPRALPVGWNMPPCLIIGISASSSVFFKNITEFRQELRGRNDRVS